MFEASKTPRVYGIEPGVDFPKAVAEGVLNRLQGTPPETLARVHILVNTRRMQRRMKALFSQNGARLLPKIGLVTEIEDLIIAPALPAPISPLHRRLSLAGLVSALLDADPTLAPRAALFDLAESLAALLDEMQGEGVDPDSITRLEIGDLSGHWSRSQTFLALVTDYLSSIDALNVDAEARRRLAVQALALQWTDHAPTTPFIVAGSTGSRGTTLELMKLISQLPQGALILPGFDTHTPAPVWSNLSTNHPNEDHPQYRFAALASALETSPVEVQKWSGSPADQSRNALISLSLRPAPITDQWLRKGPDLGDLVTATNNLALIEAPNARVEAAAIAFAMREAIDQGASVALVTPDRTLGRRVTAALSRWGIVPDDSAGRPIAQTAPGRILRLVSHMIGKTLHSDRIISLLRHPLAHTGGDDRGQHLLWTQELELFLRKNAVSEVSADDLVSFGDIDPRRATWVPWITQVLGKLQSTSLGDLGQHLRQIVEISESIARGPLLEGSGDLWDKAAGRDTKHVIDTLLDAGSIGPTMSSDDAVRFLDKALQGENTRNSDESRPDVMIWGTLEARVQGADVIILGGLNEGIWPARPTADPWLNRALRTKAGLLLPERQIGLAAHDYQQAIAAPRAILCRSIKDDDAEAVASRWLNRLTNLLNGLPDQKGPEALGAMQERGQTFIDHALAVDRPDAEETRAVRPAPAPPLVLRPKTLSVTDIETLIRDPYAIYGKYILRLRALNPLRPEPDAALRGTVFHDILHSLMKSAPFASPDEIEASFLTHSRNVLSEAVPWTGTRQLWLGHLSRIAAGFADDEFRRQSIGEALSLEVWGEGVVGDPDLRIKGKADRIDRLKNGQLAIYDYKSGAPPSADQMQHFKRQLPVEAVMAENGLFEGVSAESVAFVSHIGLNKALAHDHHVLDQTEKRDWRTVTIQGELTRLLESYMDPARGYPSRRAMEKMRWDGDYDHLARFGEWDATEEATRIDLT